MSMFASHFSLRYLLCYFTPRTGLRLLCFSLLHGILSTYYSGHLGHEKWICKIARTLVPGYHAPLGKGRSALQYLINNQRNHIPLTLLICSTDFPTGFYRPPLSCVLPSCVLARVFGFAAAPQSVAPMPSQGFPYAPKLQSSFPFAI